MGRAGLNSDVVYIVGFGSWFPLLRVFGSSVWSYSTKVRGGEERGQEEAGPRPTSLGSASCLFPMSVGLWSQTAWLYTELSGRVVMMNKSPNPSGPCTAVAMIELINSCKGFRAW